LVLRERIAELEGMITKRDARIRMLAEMLAERDDNRCICSGAEGMITGMSAEVFLGW
jgi:hypothetical protein